VPRTANLARPGALLDRVVDYVEHRGLANLSLRPLALAIDSSPRGLLYYFNSKDGLTVAILAELRRRQQRAFARLRDQDGDASPDACLAIWKIMSAPESLPTFRLFFEVYAMALREPTRFGSFLANAVGDWLSFLQTPLLRRGVRAEHASAFATLVIAGYRGFLLDLCATGDRARVDRAVELWLHGLRTIEEDVLKVA